MTGSFRVKSWTARKTACTCTGSISPPRKDGYSYLNFRLTANEDTTPVCLGGYISRSRPPTAEEKEALRSLLLSVEAEESTGKNPHPGPGGPENEPFRS